MKPQNILVEKMDTRFSSFYAKYSKVVQLLKDVKAKHNEMVSSKDVDQFKMIRNFFVVRLLENLTNFTNDLAKLYKTIRYNRSKRLKFDDYLILLKKYKIWRKFFINNYYSELYMSQDITKEEDSLAIHFFIEFSRVHFILMAIAERMSFISDLNGSFRPKVCLKQI